MKKEVIMSAFLGLACTGILLSSCSENNDDPSSKPDRTTTDEMYYANQFARDMLETYYYWNKEIAGDLPLLDPETNNDPITTVDQIKYHEGDKVIDKWTMLTNDFKSFTSGVEGVATTYGYMPVTYLLSEQGNECISAIAYVHKGSPAEKAGLKANDKILKIDGASTKGMTTKEASDKIRGKEGTQVKLLIKRGNEEKTFVVTRAVITLKAISAKPPEGVKIDENLGYIRLSTFLNKNATKEMTDILGTLSDKEGYILDLRSNPGGLLTNAILISDLFLNGGRIVSTVDRDGYKETQEASEDVFTNKPLVILINEGSASASEILSGALKDNKRAVIIGTKSFGKGLVQEINKLPDGSGVNVTIQKYLTPNGTDINKKGITPDVEVKITEEDVKKKVDPQIAKAQEVLQQLIEEKQLTLK